MALLLYRCRRERAVVSQPPMPTERDDAGDADTTWVKRNRFPGTWQAS